MKKVFLVYNAQNSFDEDEVVAVFNDCEQATRFTERHPRFYGRYRIEEKEINPYFEKTDKWVYLVIINAADEKIEVHHIDTFSEEQRTSVNPVDKHDETFYMYLFASDEKEAIGLARAKFNEMVISGEWLLLKDHADQEDDD